MKVINKMNGEVIGAIVTNHSMTIEQAIDCIGGEIITDMNDSRWSNDYDNVIINGKRYWMEDIQIVA
jgi:hypothetical protein